MNGFRHLVQCHCILPQFRKMPEPIFHKFVVFSVIDESDQVVPKLVSCNNCGVTHKVIDICKSEIAVGNEGLKSLMTKQQISENLHKNISGLLEAHECDLPVWEHVLFIVENSLWGTVINISQEDVGGFVQVKVLEILAEDRVRLRVETRNDEIVKK
jgi:hypothetical protein